MGPFGGPLFKSINSKATTKKNENIFEKWTPFGDPVFRSISSKATKKKYRLKLIKAIKYINIYKYTIA